MSYREQFRATHGTESSPSSGNSTNTNLQELVRHLTSSVHGMELMLKEAEEKDVMMQQEM
jgi:hypothetical protein